MFKTSFDKYPAKELEFRLYPGEYPFMFDLTGGAGHINFIGVKQDYKLTGCRSTSA
jgi:hypothetical protein